MTENNDNSLRQQVAKKLKEIRKNQNLTLKDVSEKSQKAISEISRVESGNRDFGINFLENLAAVYGLEVVVKFKKKYGSEIAEGRMKFWRHDKTRMRTEVKRTCGFPAI